MENFLCNLTDWNLIINAVVLIINTLALLWAVYSWRQGIKEKWINELLSASVELIGATDLVYQEVYAKKLKNSSCPEEPSPATKANFIGKEKKLLLLFAHDKAEQRDYKEAVNAFFNVARIGDTESYYKATDVFFDKINNRIQKEWKDIKKPIFPF